MGTVITMVATSTGGTESALASIDIPKAGELLAVSWQSIPLFDTTLDFQVWQLSFGSVHSAANDSRQIISQMSQGRVTLLTAAGVLIAGANFLDLLPDLVVGAGERLFLHSFAAAGVVATVYAMLHFSFDLDQPRARRR